MSIYDNQDPYAPGQDYWDFYGGAPQQPQQPQNWWEGPPPANWNGAWPPPLAPGASYGPNLGQINYGPGGAPNVYHPGDVIDQSTGQFGTPKATETPNPPVPPPPPPPPPAPPSGGGAPPPSTPGGLIKPYVPSTTMTPTDGQVNLGGPAGIPYVAAPPSFNYADFDPGDPFVAPNWDQVTQDQGFQFRRNLGEQELTNNKAMAGLLRGGATLKNFLDYNQGLASQEYGQVYNRAKDAWSLNNANRFNAWSANLNKDQQEFAPQLLGWQTATSAGQQQSAQNWDHAHQLSNDAFDVFKWNQTWPYQVLSDQQKMGLSAAMA